MRLRQVSLLSYETRVSLSEGDTITGQMKKKDAQGNGKRAIGSGGQVQKKESYNILGLATLAFTTRLQACI